MPRQFCTDLSLAAGETLIGTGGHHEKIIFIRWPKGKWRYSVRQADDMSEDLLSAIEAVAEAGWRVNLIDRKGEMGSTVILAPSMRKVSLNPEDLSAWLTDFVAGRQDLGTLQPQPTSLFVCTHGVHDRCCAKFGFAAFKALRAVEPSDIDVWEVTHLGGCRLAGGALSLPSRRKYGRIMPKDAAELLDAELADRPYLPCYRGRGGLTPLEQVAEAALLAEGVQANVFGPPVDAHSTQPVEEGTVATVEAQSGRRAWTVVLRARDVLSPGTCKTLDEGGQGRRVDWDVVEIAERSAA